MALLPLGPSSEMTDFEIVRKVLASTGCDGLGSRASDAADFALQRIEEQQESTALALDASINNHAKDTAYLITQRDEWKATAQRFEEQLEVALEQRDAFTYKSVDIERLQEQLEATERALELSRMSIAALEPDSTTRAARLEEILADALGWIYGAESDDTRAMSSWIKNELAALDSSPATESAHERVLRVEHEWRKELAAPDPAKSPCPTCGNSEWTWKGGSDKSQVYCNACDPASDLHSDQSRGQNTAPSGSTVGIHHDSEPPGDGGAQVPPSPASDPASRSDDG